MRGSSPLRLLAADQDTADSVAKRYGRSSPKDKAARAAKILNKAWEDA